MNNLMQIYEKEQIKKLTSKKSIPTFRSGDTIKVTLKIIEGERSRLQSFEGMCIARKNNLLNSKFTIRKISHGEGVEKVFPLFSPNIDKIEVIRKGDVKRAKLYFLRERKGKSARIFDRDRGDEKDQYSMTENEVLNIEKNMQGKISSEDQKSSDNNNTKLKDEITSESVKEPVVEDKKSKEKESESTASKADKTDDESKS